MLDIQSITLNGHSSRFLHKHQPNKPPMVVLPGNLQEIDSIAPFNNELSKDYNYFALELPGTGKNKPLHPSYTMEYLSNCLSDFTEQLGLEPIVLVACSYATPIALEYSKKNNVSQLVLAGSMREIPQEKWGDALGLMSDCLRDRQKFADSFIAALSVEDDAIPRRKAVYRAAKTKANNYTDDQFWCFINNSIRLMSYRPQKLDDIKCPTLCFTGHLDPYVTKELCDELAGAIPNSVFSTIPNTDHLFLIQKPIETTTLIQEFLGRYRIPLAA